MPQYEFIESRFLARTQVNRITKQVRRLGGLFTTTSNSWPDKIEYDLVAVITGSIKSERILAKGTSQFVEHTYRDRYDNPDDSFSINDVVNGRMGGHYFYPIDLTNAQKYIMEYISALAGEGWEPLSAPTALGVQRGVFDIIISPPSHTRWEFPGGELRFYIGQDKNNPSGVAYSFKRIQVSDIVSTSVYKTNFCVHCGRSLVLGSKFCVQCGQLISLE